MLTRIADRNILWVYIHIDQLIKNRGPGPYNSLRHSDNRKIFFGSLSNTNSKVSAHVLLDERSGKNLEMFLLRKNFLKKKISISLEYNIYNLPISFNILMCICNVYFHILIHMYILYILYICKMGMTHQLTKEKFKKLKRYPKFN